MATMHKPGTNFINRRQMLARSSTGFGLMALSGLMADPAFAGTAAVNRKRRAAKAKKVIFCFMSGGG